MNVPFNDLKREYNSIKQEIDSAIQLVIDKTSFIKGEFYKSFEEEYAHYCGVAYCVGCSSGTTALHLALMAFGVGEGDEVITVSNTFIGTTEPIAHAGAAVVFVDIDKDTYTIDLDLIEKAITPRTKAIIPVHLYGQMANSEAICEIAKRHGLIVIEDAAQAVGASFKGSKSGQLSDAACFSFYPGKNLGAYGDAGCVVTNSGEAAEKMHMLSDHGRKSKYAHDIEGYNYRMDALQAAVISVKLRHIDDWNENRRKVAHYYSEHITNPDIVVPAEHPDAYHCYHIYCIRARDRDSASAQLKEKGVANGIHYPIPLHLQKAYSHLGVDKWDLPVTENYADTILSLPIFPFMTQEEIEYVVEAVNNID